MNGWAWIMDRVKQGRHNGTYYHDWGIAAPTTPLTAAAGAGDATGPNGTYQFYYTYATSDGFYETDPSPVSAPVTVALQDVDFSAVSVSADTEVGVRNIYATGGTLGGAYLVASIPNNTATTSTPGTTNWYTNDLTVTDKGITMPTTHDLPPAGKGLAGPYFSRLYTWVGNRLYYTPPGLPQYWSTDPAVGDWIDVGIDGEDIQWCTCHTNVLVIYKQRSIWVLIGDPATGSLQQVEDGVGLTSAFGVVAASGQLDYFTAPNGLRMCNTERTTEMGPDIRPLFNSPIANPTSPLYPPGSILPGTHYLADSIDCYGASLGYAMGKLYVAYDEKTTTDTPGQMMLVYFEQEKRWMYHRNSLGVQRFQGFFFDGIMMLGLTGAL